MIRIEQNSWLYGKGILFIVKNHLNLIRPHFDKAISNLTLLNIFVKHSQMWWYKNRKSITYFITTKLYRSTIGWLYSRNFPMMTIVCSQQGTAIKMGRVHINDYLLSFQLSRHKGNFPQRHSQLTMILHKDRENKLRILNSCVPWDHEEKWWSR